MKVQIKTEDREFLKQFMFQVVMAEKRREKMQIPAKLPIVRRFSPIRIPSPPPLPPIEKPKKE